jgi:hypothetical protein
MSSVMLGGSVSGQRCAKPIGLDCHQMMAAPTAAQTTSRKTVFIGAVSAQRTRHPH